jgi:hypothetical protein
MPAYEQTGAEAKSNPHAEWMMKSYVARINELKPLLEKRCYHFEPL